MTKRAFGWAFGHPLLRRIFRLVIKLAVIFAVISALWVSLYRFVNPPITSLMVMEYFRVGKLEQTWKPLNQISPHLWRASIAAEDQFFCVHYGFNLREIRAAFLDPTRRRGGSSITQQTAKNAFLWPDPSWLRKGIEAGFTVYVELFWPKTRTLEVYLNIAEFGIGVFGAEAAAQYYFGKSADRLTAEEARRLAAILPSPRRRSPNAISATRLDKIRRDTRYLEHIEHYDCLPDKD